ncbi:hypothetical protein D3C74_420490 [compost metagenome]
MVSRIALRNLRHNCRLAVVTGPQADGYGILNVLAVCGHGSGRFLCGGVIFGEYANQDMPFRSRKDVSGIPDTACQHIKCGSVPVQTLLNLTHSICPPQCHVFCL